MGLCAVSANLEDFFFFLFIFTAFKSVVINMYVSFFVSFIFFLPLLAHMKAANAQCEHWKFIIFILAGWDGGLGTVRFSL